MLDALVDTLLYEGYALYPYTPGATKNATPTPFGIVYPPVYAAGSGATFDHLQIECAVLDGAAASRARSTSCRPAGCATRARRAASSSRPCAHGEAHGRPFDFDGLRGRASIALRRRAA